MGKIVKEFTIKARSGYAFEVKQGQILRIIEAVGPQVADVNFFNLHNFRERLHAPLSAAYNRSFQKFTKLYTNAARPNVIFTVVDDPVGVHFLSGAHCTSLHYELFWGIENHPNCFDNLAKAIEPWGLTSYDVHGVFNAFMKVRYDDGKMIILPPVSKKGDYIDLRAEMDVLVAISACPGDISPTNGEDRIPKPLDIVVHEV